MRRFCSSRLFRILVCLVLICCFLVNSSPIKVEAAVAEGLIAAASAINVPAAVAIAATLICLGVMADASGVTFNSVVSDVQEGMRTIGHVLEDGTVQMLRIVDEAGTAAYYAAGDLLEDVRGWLFDSGVCVQLPLSEEQFSAVASVWLSYHSDKNIISFCVRDSGGYYSYYFVASYARLVFEGDYLVARTSTGDLGQLFYYQYNPDTGSVSQDYGSKMQVVSNGAILYSSLYQDIGTLDGLTLGQVSSVPIDGTSAKTWAADYAAKGLYVIDGGGSSEDPDDGGEGNNNWKWFLPLALTLTTAEMYAMSQADQWLAQTPAEFNDFSTSQEFDVSVQPEIDGYQAIQIDPATEPDTGTDTSPDAGTDVDPDAGTGSGSWTPPNDHKKFKLVDLQRFFPFCIPFDLFYFFELLNADPVAPVLYWEMQDLSGQVYSLTIDFSEWDSVAQLFRRLQLFLFIVGLAAASRKFIKW